MWLSICDIWKQLDMVRTERSTFFAQLTILLVVCDILIPLGPEGVPLSLCPVESMILGICVNFVQLAPLTILFVVYVAPYLIPSGPVAVTVHVRIKISVRTKGGTFFYCS